MKRFLRLLPLCLFWAGFVYAQDAVVSRNVNLRPNASTTKKKIETLQPGAKLLLLTAKQKRGYYHVQTSDGQKGWVWGKNIKMGKPLVATVRAALIGNAVSPDWEKFDPAANTFTNANGKVCKDGGDDKDRTTYRYKDRVDTAEDHSVSYHTVSLAAVKALPYFANERTSALDGFKSPADKTEVFKYEGAPVELEGWLADDLRNEKGEATNCGSTAATDVDWHLVIAGKGEDPSKSVFVEITPRVRPHHPKWDKSNFTKGAHLRVQGWLMYDPDHKNQMTLHQRATLWEVHPVVRVWKEVGGQWVDLDQ
jgi:hypothetical protein